MAVVEFRLFSDAPLSFKTQSVVDSGMSVIRFTKIANATAEKLENVKGCSTKFLGQLEGLLAQPSTGVKRRRLSNTKLLVQVQYTDATWPGIPSGRFRVKDDDDENEGKDESVHGNGHLARLVRICGGFENVKLDLELEFGTSADDSMKLTQKDKMLDDVSYSRPLIIESLKENWKKTQTKFIGKLSLTVKLNQEAVDQILEKSHALNFEAFNRKLLEQAETFGDAVILLDNGVKVHCHKGILAAQSDVFQAMFSSGMKETSSSTVEMRDVSEGSVRALLAYLYCGDIKKPLRCSLTATELLSLADKYGIAKLFETMKELVFAKEDEWFGVAAALNLLSLGKNRAEDGVFKEIEAKAKVVLGTKSRDEFKQCTDFMEMLSNPETAFDLCTYFIWSK